MDELMVQACREQGVGSVRVIYRRDRFYADALPTRETAQNIAFQSLSQEGRTPRTLDEIQDAVMRAYDHVLARGHGASSVEALQQLLTSLRAK